MAQVSLEKITRQLAQTKIIEDITFTVPDGQFWALVGPSGCGKSTILRSIAGLETITSGQLYIGNQLVNNLPPRERDVAMVFQNYALYPHMTVGENIAFGLKMRGLDQQIIQQKVETVAHSLKIAHLLKRLPRQLSGGQQQRVALGRAIARQPKVFLLDEPLSNLDAQLRELTRTELKQLHQQVQITTIYVTHDQVEAMTLADQIVVLNQGQIQQIGTPQEIYQQPFNRMVATFMGSPPMNLIPAVYRDEQLLINGQTLPFKSHHHLPVNTPIEVGIRPEHLTLSPDSPLETPLLVEIQLIEPLGPQTLVRANLAGSDLLINFSAPGDFRATRGDRLAVNLDFNHLHFFDLVNGENLRFKS